MQVITKKKKKRNTNLQLKDLNKKICKYKNNIKLTMFSMLPEIQLSFGNIKTAINE